MIDLDLAYEVVEGVSARTLPEDLESLVAFALNRSGAAGEWEIAIRFVNDETIRDLHRDYMGLDTPTDIMTFPYATDLPGVVAPALGGDIVISVDIAAANSTEAGWDLTSELRFLVLHGVLHLLNWDDTSQDERAAMLREQHELLAEWLAARS